MRKPRRSPFNSIATLAFLAAVWAASGCSSKAFYGGMIGAGIGGLQGETVSGALIGAGVGGMIDHVYSVAGLVPVSETACTRNVCEP